MDEIIFEVHEDDAEGGFVARALGQSIVTQAETWDELRRNIREAVLCHFDEGPSQRLRLRLLPAGRFASAADHLREW